MRAEPRTNPHVDQTLLSEKTLHKKFAKVGYTGASVFLCTGGNTLFAISAMALTTFSELTLRKEKALAQTESLLSFKTVRVITKTIAYSLIAKLFFSAVINTLNPNLFEIEEPLQSGLNEAFSGEDKYFIYGVACGIAPVTEEISFRGFLQERAEDALQLFSSHIYLLNQKLIKTIACIFQAAVFGYCHIINGQVIKGAELFIAGMLAIDGYFWGCMKNETNSVIPSIFVHSLENFIAIRSLFPSAPAA